MPPEEVPSSTSVVDMRPPRLKGAIRRVNFSVGFSPMWS